MHSRSGAFLMSQLIADDHHPQRPQQRYTNLYTDLAQTVRELGSASDCSATPGSSS
jgi:hypothetical protein